MVFYETLEAYEAYTSAECAANFLEIANNASLATLLSMAYMFRGYLANIPYVGSILLAYTVLLSPERTGNHFEYSVGMLDLYFQCAIGEPGFSQELYDGDFRLKMAYINDLKGEVNQVYHVPFLGIYKLITNGLEIRTVLDSFAGSTETTEGIETTE